MPNNQFISTYYNSSLLSAIQSSVNKLSSMHVISLCICVYKFWYICPTNSYAAGFFGVIWGPHSSDHEYNCCLECNALKSGIILPMFRRDVQPIFHALNVDVARSPEKSVNFYRLTLRNIPEES
jgi:hypothetical protein